jgi:hypothetical protein
LVLLFVFLPLPMLLHWRLAYEPFWTPRQTVDAPFAFLHMARRSLIEPRTVVLVMVLVVLMVVHVRVHVLAPLQLLSLLIQPCGPHQ